MPMKYIFHIYIVHRYAGITFTTMVYFTTSTVTAATNIATAAVTVTTANSKNSELCFLSAHSWFLCLTSGASDGGIIILERSTEPTEPIGDVPQNVLDAASLAGKKAVEDQSALENSLIK